MESTTKAISGNSWYNHGVNLVEGLKNGLTNKWSYGNNSLINKIKSLASSLTNTLKNAFGIHSPSKIWEDEIGYNLTKGLEVGVLGEEGHLNNAILGMGARLNNAMSGALTLATPKSILCLISVLLVLWLILIVLIPLCLIILLRE